ncbi:alpha/beta hydrolase [Kribbella solani]|uniref:S-formylglutathione hydrolase FrmB n=1 Tax=Kribbella solani TaxID=236067 RepID=A0A841DN69_9ACTN|nr:alpha/beta hydrolase-fold protein [Kribbella solani]MBB5978445.1 S-formylglutathione hydrolase FrmB [Kribbella solani]
MLGVSLLGGWLPVVAQILAAGVLLLAIGWRDRRWRVRWLPVAGVLAVVATLILKRESVALLGITDPLPATVWIWAGCAIGAVLVLVLGWRSARWWRRGTALLAALLAAFVCANGLNQFTGYYPTIGAVWNDWTHTPLPGVTSISSIKHQPPTDGKILAEGKLVAVTIPSTHSGFPHREEYVYLPPAWFRGPAFRHTLPVVELIGGERGGPPDWVRLGNAPQTANTYAAQHNGYAPILIFADATGGFSNDTECVNGPRGQAEDHLVKDIPNYITKTFDTTTDPNRWGIAGFSMGGTCALSLVVEHPNTFRHFVDISGDLTPNSGNPTQTLSDLYGGSTKDRALHDPQTVMRTHGPYTGVSGLFLVSNTETIHIREAGDLSRAAAKVGIKTQLIISPGSHVWQFAAPAFAQAFPQFVSQLTPNAPPNGTVR